MELDKVSQSDFQVSFEEDPQGFLSEITNSLMGRGCDFGESIGMENYKFIQQIVLERMEHDSEFFKQYYQTCFSFLFAYRESIPASHQKFLLGKLSSEDTFIRRAIFGLLKARKLPLDRNNFMVDLQNEIENVLNGDDDLTLQQALEIIRAFGITEFRLLLNGAQQKFSQKITEIRTQPSEANIWHEAYLINAIAGIQQVLP